MRLLIIMLFALVCALQYRLWFGPHSVKEYFKHQEELKVHLASNLELEKRNKMLLADVADLQSGLDSIDEIDRAGERIHCNEHGWFAMAGWPQEPDNQHKLLLKPGKLLMTAVCCGHQWRNGERKTPRLLSLREMLLASRLNWQNFAKPHPSNRNELRPGRVK